MNGRAWEFVATCKKSGWHEKKSLFGSPLGDRKSCLQICIPWLKGCLFLVTNNDTF